MLKKSLFIGISICSFVSLCVRGQGETKELDSVAVVGTTLQSSGIQTLSKQRIDRRLATDVGQLMLLFPGVQLRSYGGLGGLKTVSFRSLGAAHTSVVMDYFALSQTQSGQTDLGQLPVDFIQQLAVVSQASTSLDYPIQAKLAGQIIAIQTKHISNNKDSLSLIVGVQYGSFNQKDGHFYVGQQFKKWRYGISAKLRQFDGNYPFSYRNGSTTVQETRLNSDLIDGYGTASLSFQLTKKQVLYLSYSGAQFDKGLPGAVVFYNTASAQRLNGVNQIITARHSVDGQRLKIATTIDYQENTLTYVDSNYLNTAGFLRSDFRAKQLGSQTQVRYAISPSTISVLLGTGIRYEELITNDFSILPRRITVDGIAATELAIFGTTSIQFGFQHIEDIRPIHSKTANYFLPAVDWFKKIGKRISLGFNYRYTVRQPSFNELYYGQIGNEDLRPEKAHIFSLRLSYSTRINKLYTNTKIQPFYVYATDKILAVPTKNLFIWSIQNIGISQALGTEFTESLAVRFKRSTLSLNLNYTFQITQDISNSNNATYGHQLSYSPLHSGTAELSFEYEKWGISTLMSYQGERYALVENISANLLEDFILLDASVFYKQSLSVLKKQKHQLTVRFAVNNITNNFVNYIRYFVMPGRNFTLKLSYEL